MTEAIDKLREEGIRIDEVVILSTHDSDAKSSLNLLSEDITEYYKGEVKIIDVRQVSSYYDIDSQEAVLKFMEEACNVLRDYKKQNCEVYVSIAGGRKTMSALMVLAVQIYGANALFHVIVEDPEIEEKGKVSKLRNSTKEEKMSVLHPNPSQIKVVRMPFIGLFPYLNEILGVLKEGKGEKGIIKLLKDNDLIDDSGKPTPMGNMVCGIIERVESIPEPYEEKKKPHISEHGYSGARKKLEELANKLLRVSFVYEVKSTEYEAKEKESIKVNSDLSLVVTYPVKGFSLALLIYTTAKTRAQAEAAARKIKEILEY